MQVVKKKCHHYSNELHSVSSEGKVTNWIIKAKCELISDDVVTLRNIDPLW